MLNDGKAAGQTTNGVASPTTSSVINIGILLPPSQPETTKRKPKRRKGLIPKGGVVASALNLTSATLGAGTLALPYAMQSAGLIVGVLFLIICCAATVYSIRLLVRIIDLTGYRTYEEMARNLVGKRFEQLTIFLIFIFCWGIASAYVTAVGDLLSSLSDLDSFPDIFKGIAGRRILSCLFWASLMLPLSLAKEINSLRYASLVGMLCTNVVVGAVVYHSVVTPDNADLVSASSAPNINNVTATTSSLRSFVNEGFSTGGGLASSRIPLTRTLTPASFALFTPWLDGVSHHGIFYEQVPLVDGFYKTKGNSTQVLVESRNAESVQARSIFQAQDTPAKATQNNPMLPLIQLNLKAITALPIIIFAFCCQSNCFEIYGELKKRSVARMTRISGWAMGLCTVIYIICGIAGASEFGERTLGNILANYRHPTEIPYIMFSFLCISLTITTSFPMCIFPMREAVLQSMGYANKDKDHSESCSDASVTKLGSTSLSKIVSRDPSGPVPSQCHPVEKVTTDALDSPTPCPNNRGEAPSHVRIPVAALLSIMSMLVGLFAPEISVFFGLLGGICGSTLSFIWPSLFVMMLDWNKDQHLLKIPSQTAKAANCHNKDRNRTSRKKKYSALSVHAGRNESFETKPLAEQTNESIFSASNETTNTSSPTKRGRRVWFKLNPPQWKRESEQQPHVTGETRENNPATSDEPDEQELYEADGDSIPKHEFQQSAPHQGEDDESTENDDEQDLVTLKSDTLADVTFSLTGSERVGAWLLMVGGVLSGVFGTAVSIYVAAYQ